MGRKPNQNNMPKGYDRTLELLLTLGPVEIKKCTGSTPLDDRPFGTLIKDLAKQFGHSKDDPVRKLIIDTQVRHKVVLVTYQTTEGSSVGVASQHYQRARNLAEAYWARVYETAEQGGEA